MRICALCYIDLSSQWRPLGVITRGFNPATSASTTRDGSARMLVGFNGKFLPQVVFHLCQNGPACFLGFRAENSAQDSEREFPSEPPQANITSKKSQIKDAHRLCETCQSKMSLYSCIAMFILVRSSQAKHMDYPISNYPHPDVLNLAYSRVFRVRSRDY